MGIHFIRNIKVTLSLAIILLASMNNWVLFNIGIWQVFALDGMRDPVEIAPWYLWSWSHLSGFLTFVAVTLHRQSYHRILGFENNLWPFRFDFDVQCTMLTLYDVVSSSWQSCGYSRLYIQYSWWYVGRTYGYLTNDIQAEWLHFFREL